MHFQVKDKNPFGGAFPDFSTYELWYPFFSGLAAPVKKLKSDLDFVCLLLKCTVASNAVLCLPGPQFPHQCRSRLSRRTRPALRQRDSLWQNLGAARIAAQASGCRLGHRHPASGAVLWAGGCRLGSRLQTWSKKVGTRPPAGSGTARPRPRSQRPCGSRGLSSALRLPRSLRPPPSLARSLPPAGSALTPPHAAAAAGRWRGTTAARCWTKSSPPSSSTISPTRRYGQLGPQARSQGCRAAGVAAAAAEAGRQWWAH